MKAIQNIKIKNNDLFSSDANYDSFHNLKYQFTIDLLNLVKNKRILLSLLFESIDYFLINRINLIEVIKTIEDTIKQSRIEVSNNCPIYEEYNKIVIDYLSEIMY